jgi:hypothetical protein
MTPQTVTPQIHDWLAPFGLEEFLLQHVAEVLAALPPEVREDLMGDPAFVIYDYEPGVIMHVPMRLGISGPARTVVLKRTLRRRSEQFIRWLIAHELAHSFLRHGLRGPNKDKAANDEATADALAAQWGFTRPAEDLPIARAVFSHTP